MQRLLSLLVVAAALACTNDVSRDAVVEFEDTDTTGAFTAPVDLDAERIYLGETRAFSINDEFPFRYGVFELLPRASVWIDVWQSDENEDPVGFKVYRVRGDGTLAFLGSIDGSDGWAWARLRSQSGGTYVVQAAAGTLPSYLSWQVSCARQDGNCAPTAQPGELCGTRGVTKSCDDGLYCAFSSECGRTDSGGTCERPAEVCPAVFGPEVCGCDGKTYGTACSASSAGVAVDFEGACPCLDPFAYSKPAGWVDVIGEWIGGLTTDANNISSRLALNADGTFTYEQVWEPTCLRTPPYCRMPTRLFSMHGTWEHQGFAVQLYPVQDPDALPIPEELAQSFGIETNCDGAVRLVTTELGIDRVLERDPCWGFACAEGEVCELMQVVCIRAPCPPLPQCVALP